jgi:nitrate reductase assembly molybdenum cofactor insertion protein NarJ
MNNLLTTKVLSKIKNLAYIADIFVYPLNDSYIKSLENFKNLIKDQEILEIISELIKIYENGGLIKLEELHTLTFDMRPLFYPYLSYHIHYDSFNRNTQMIKLREIYGKYDFYLDKELNELPDHIYIILKFLSLIDNEEDIVKEIANNYIIPALINYYNSTFKQLKEEIINNNPYCKLLNYIIVELI